MIKLLDKASTFYFLTTQFFARIDEENFDSSKTSCFWRRYFAKLFGDELFDSTQS